MSAENCQVCGKTKDVNVAGHCQGHTGGATASASDTSAVSGSSIKDLLDAIPTPSKVANPAPSTATGTGMGALSAGGQAASTTRAPQADPYVAAQDPAAVGGAQPGQPAGEVPQWMRNFKEYQSEILPGQGGAGGNAPAANANPWSSSNSTTDLPSQSGSYTVMIGAIVLICVIMFAYMMMNKPPATTETTTTTTSPASTTPAATVAPTTAAPSAYPTGTTYPGQVQGQIPGQVPGQVPGQTQQPVGTYPPAISPNPVPGAPDTTPPAISPNPVPGAPDPLQAPNPVPGMPAASPNPVPNTPAGTPNPVPGNNP